MVKHSMLTFDRRVNEC